MPSPQKPNLIGGILSRFGTCCLAASFWLASGAFAQTPGEPILPPVAKTQTVSPKSQAYYHFTLGHLYEELASAYGNRSDYVNKAIENYRLAMKEDPDAKFLVADIAELYQASNRTREAVEEAQSALKADPNDINARRVLARIYTSNIGDPQNNHVDEAMVHRAIDEYKQIVKVDPKDNDSLVMLGRLDRLINDSADAEAVFKQVLASDPENEDAITGLASVYAERNDPKQAAELLEKLSSKHASPRALVALASYYEQMREFGKAADAYRRALEADPNRPELRNAMAQDLAAAGRAGDAVKAYQAAAAANPTDPAPYLGIAAIYRDQHEYGKAHEALNKAKDIDPNNLDIRLEESRILEAEGRTADAIASLKSVVDATARREKNVPAQARAELLDSLGRLYLSASQYDHAIESFRQAASLSSDLAAREDFAIAEAYREANDYSHALSESEAALKQFPKDRTLIEVRAEILSDVARYDEAIALLKSALGSGPNHDLEIAMAEVYQKSKNFTEMAKVLDAAEKDANSTEDKIAVESLRGAMHERQKKYDEAEQQFRLILSQDADNASALNYLGYMLADRGVRLNEARELIRRAVKLEPNNYAFLDSLGWVEYKLDQLPEAEEQLKHSVALHGTDPTIHDHLGDVYAKEGKLKQAVEEWQVSLRDYHEAAPSEQDPEEMSKVQKKLDEARVKLAKTQGRDSSLRP